MQLVKLGIINPINSATIFFFVNTYFSLKFIELLNLTSSA